MLSYSAVRKSHYYNTFLPSLTQTTPLDPGLMKARLPKNEMCCDWLAFDKKKMFCVAAYTYIIYIYIYIYIQINSLPAGGAVVVVESEVSLATLYTKQSSTHTPCFIMQDEKKMTSKIF